MITLTKSGENLLIAGKLIHSSKVVDIITEEDSLRIVTEIGCIEDKFNHWIIDGRIPVSTNDAMTLALAEIKETGIHKKERIKIKDLRIISNKEFKTIKRYCRVWLHIRFVCENIFLLQKFRISLFGKDAIIGVIDGLHKDCFDQKDPEDQRKLVRSIQKKGRLIKLGVRLAYNDVEDLIQNPPDKRYRYLEIFANNEYENIYIPDGKY